MSPWWRTRRSLSPSPRSAASARSICRSFSGVTGSKCGIREARQGAAGLSATGQVERPGDAAYVGLGQPGVGQGPEHRVVGRRAAARAGPAGDVVGVLAVRDRVESVRPSTSPSIVVNSSSLQWKQRSGPLATYAARSPSRVSISTTGTPISRRDLVRAGSFLGRQAGGDAEHGDDVVSAQHPGGQGQQHRGVDPAGEGHAEPPYAGQRRRDRRLGVGQSPRGCDSAHGNHASRCPAR